MMLLGILARETAGENQILWTVLLCGAALCLGIMSSRETEKRIFVNLLLFSFFLAGVGRSLWVAVSRERAERPLAEALHAGRDTGEAEGHLASGDTGEAEGHLAGEDTGEEVAHLAGGDSREEAGIGAGDNTGEAENATGPNAGKKTGIIEFTGEVISVRETAYGMQLTVESGSVRVMVETESVRPAGVASSKEAESGKKAGEKTSNNKLSGEATGNTSVGNRDESAEEEILPGEFVYVSGQVTIPSGPRNPGAYDEKETLRTQGISYVIEKADVEKNGKKCFIRYKLSRLSCRLEKSLYRIFPEREASVLAAMLLGERAGMDPETKLLYQKNGMAHVLAISGMHVALLASALRFLLGLLRIRRKTASLLVMGILPVYALMTGMSIPVVRALIMLLLRELAVILDRTEDMATSLVLSLVLLAFFRPWAVFSAGLFMSFAAVSAVLFGGELSKQILGVQRLRGLPRRWRKMLLILLPGFVTVILLNLFMLPLLLFFYYEFPLYSMGLNLVVIPLMSYLVAGGFAAALLGLLPGGIFLWMARAVSIGPYLILRLYEWLCRLTLRLPHALVNPGHISFPILLGSYMAMTILLLLLLRKGRGEAFSRKRFCLFLSGALLLFLLIPSVTGWMNARKSRVVFLDVGQGDGCICHARGGPNLIMDCGSGSDSVGKNVLIPSLKYYGMSEIDAVFISHTDRDHTIGIRFLLENADLYGIHVERLIFAEGTEQDEMMRSLQDAADRCGTEVILVSAGAVLQWTGCQTEVLYPFVTDLSKEDGMRGTGVREDGMRGTGVREDGMRGTGVREDSMRGTGVQEDGVQEDSKQEDYSRGTNGAQMDNLKETNGAQMDNLGGTNGAQMDNLKEPNGVNASAGGSGNDYSLVIRLNLEDIRILFTGDIGMEVEEKLIHKYGNTGSGRLNADILKCAHHGSRYSSSEEFLEAVSPAITVISCGRNNMYGHPHAETLGRLENVGTKVVRTDLCGAVIVE